MWDLVIAFTVVLLAHGRPTERVERYRLSYDTRFACEAADETAYRDTLIALRERSSRLRRVRSVPRATTYCQDRGAFPL